MNNQEKESREKFIAVIEKYCRSKNPVILHKDIAIEMGVTPSVVSYYLSGHRRIPDNHLAAMCIALKLPIRTQKQIYSILGRNMPDYDGFGDEREQIILHYMENCSKNDSETVRACNAELTAKNLIPLTGRRGKRS